MEEQNNELRLRNEPEEIVASVQPAQSQSAPPRRPKLTLLTTASLLNHSHVVGTDNTISNPSVEPESEPLSAADTEIDSDTSTLLEACRAPSPKYDILSPQLTTNTCLDVQRRQARKERWRKTLNAFKARLTPLFLTGYRTGREDACDYAGFHAYEAANAQRNASKECNKEIDFPSNDSSSGRRDTDSSASSIVTTTKTTSTSLSSASTAVASVPLSTQKTRKPSLFKRGFTKMQTDPEEKAWLKTERQKKREEELHRQALALADLYGYQVGMAPDERGNIDWRVAWAGAAIF